MLPFGSSKYQLLGVYFIQSSQKLSNRTTPYYEINNVEITSLVQKQTSLSAAGDGMKEKGAIYD